MNTVLWKTFIAAGLVLALALVGCGDDADSGGMTAEDNEAPSALLSLPASGAVGIPTLLDATNSFDPDGVIEAWWFEISLEGQAPDEVLQTTSPQLYHTFPRAGRYDIGLTVIDNQGRKGSTSESLLVN